LKVLLHICCAPCLIYPAEVLSDKYDLMGYFYRDNIHPFQECLKRENTLRAYSEKINLKVIYQEGYHLENFIQAVVFRENQRCRFCYYERMNATAKIAKKGKFDGFSSTLLYSKFQNHDLIKLTGESVAKKNGLKFIYHDFREGWKYGIEESKKLDMYRQQYCGCIYSEKERYLKTHLKR